MSAPAVPAEAVRALAPVLGEPEGAPVALAGGITNRNYRLRWGGRDCVLRMPGKDTALLGIDRARGVGGDPRRGGGRHRPARRSRSSRASAAWSRSSSRAARSSRRSCAARIPELAAALRTIHGGAALPASFDAFAVVEQYRRIAERARRRAAAGLRRRSRTARAPSAPSRGPEHAPVPCHNDLLSANVLDDGRRLRILDWEYAGMGDRYFDLGNLAANNGFTEADDEALLERLLARRLHAPAARRAAADARDVGLPRGRCGASSRPPSPSSTSTSRATPPSTSAASPARSRTRGSATWLEDARG